MGDKTDQNDAQSCEGNSKLFNIKELQTFLDTRKANYTMYHHPAVFTVSEAAEHTGHLPGAHVKNLFLEDKKGGLWLFTAWEQSQIKVNKLARFLGAPRFSFAKEDRLIDVLGVKPGSVTPLALLNDDEREVHFLMDQKITEYELINVHPLVNTATVSLPVTDLLQIITSLGYEPRMIDLEEVAGA